MTIRMSITSAVAAVLLAATGLSVAQTLAENPTTPPPKPERQAPKVEKNLKVFDTLDFDVFSNQKWERLHESHAKDCLLYTSDAADE